MRTVAALVAAFLLGFLLSRYIGAKNAWCAPYHVSGQAHFQTSDGPAHLHVDTDVPNSSWYCGGRPYISSTEGRFE